jgi:hypothetical protein
MIDMHVQRVERLDQDRYRVAVQYGEIVVHNIVAMLRDGRVHAVHPPAIRATGRWVPLVTWSQETRERIRVLVDDAITHGRIRKGAVA